MKLLRIKVEQLRQFRQPFELSGLMPGLNLFTGPNEAGKSTVVRAIRAAFLDRHRSSSVSDLLPWGDAAGAPTVELDFELGGQLLSLRKSFLGRKRCELKVGSKPLDGEEAEQHLAELLGFEFPGRGASKPEHWGIPGLLWIEQGAGQEIAESVGHATDHLRKALDQSVGEVASSQGDDIITIIRGQRDALLTSTGRPRAAYLEATNERDGLKSRLVDLDQRIAQYRQQVDELARVLAEDVAEAQSRPWEMFRSQQVQAQGRVAAIEVLKGQLAADVAAVGQLKEKQKLIEAQLESFEAQQRDLKTREVALTDAHASVLTEQAASEIRAAASSKAQADYHASNEALALSHQEDRRAGLMRLVADGLARSATAALTISKAQTEQSLLASFKKLAHETLLSLADMTLLRQQQAKLDELRIRREAAATRLSFDLTTGASIALGQQALTGQGERLISGETRLSIPGVGTLTITPGGTDLAALAREEEALLARHQALLQRVGVASLDEAELRYASHRQAMADSVHAQKTFDNLAPGGLDTLREELDCQTASQLKAQAQLDQLPVPPGQPVEAIEQATAHQAAANAFLETVTRKASAALLALATAQTQRDAAHRERDALLVLLEAPERKSRQGDINQNALNTRAEHDALQARVLARREEVEAARSDILAQDVERFRRSADQSERVFRERQTDITVLKTKLEEAGAQGLEESRAQVAARADAAGKRLGELTLRAEALDLLCSLLDAKRAASTRRLQAPLQKHIHRYLQLLLPHATLDIGADLIPGLLTRVGSRGLEAGQFSDMSYGAREQMGVISRLAYADLLKEAGRPTLIIMDDALVHSDTQRLEQMKRVIFDASQRHQVLVFTCHPAAWQNVGAHPVPIGQAA